jgi:hypothetical protein
VILWKVRTPGTCPVGLVLAESAGSGDISKHILIGRAEYGHCHP